MSSFQTQTMLARALKVTPPNTCDLTNPNNVLEIGNAGVPTSPNVNGELSVKTTRITKKLGSSCPTTMPAQEPIGGVKTDCTACVIGKADCASRSHSGIHEIRFSKNASMVYLAQKETTEKMSKSVTTILMRPRPARMPKPYTNTHMLDSLTIDCMRQVVHALGLNRNSKF
jgi:hypothetical protein